MTTNQSTWTDRELESLHAELDRTVMLLLGTMNAIRIADASRTPYEHRGIMAAATLVGIASAVGDQLWEHARALLPTGQPVERETSTARTGE